MKAGITYVDASKFEAIILSSGLEVELKKGWVKVKGPQGRNVYVPLTKRIGRVDISGFEVEDDGVVTLTEQDMIGNVGQQLDMSRSPTAILETFAKVLEHMKSLAPVTKLVRKVPSAKADGPVGWTCLNK